MRRIAILIIFFKLIYFVIATKCIIKEKSQEDSEIQVIHLVDDSSDSSDDPEVIAIHVPDRRKREIWNTKTKAFCKTDDDCDSGEKCIAYLRCVKIDKKIETKKKPIEQETKI